MDEMQILIRESFNQYGLQRYVCEYRDDVFMESLVKTKTIYPAWTQYDTRTMRVSMYQEHKELHYGLRVSNYTREESTFKINTIHTNTLDQLIPGVYIIGGILFIPIYHDKINGFVISRNQSRKHVFSLIDRIKEIIPDVYIESPYFVSPSIPSDSSYCILYTDNLIDRWLMIKTFFDLIYHRYDSIDLHDIHIERMRSMYQDKVENKQDRFRYAYSPHLPVLKKRLPRNSIPGLAKKIKKLRKQMGIYFPRGWYWQKLNFIKTHIKDYLREGDIFDLEVILRYYKEWQYIEKHSTSIYPDPRCFGLKHTKFHFKERDITIPIAVNCMTLMEFAENRNMDDFLMKFFLTAQFVNKCDEKAVRNYDPSKVTIISNDKPIHEYESNFNRQYFSNYTNYDNDIRDKISDIIYDNSWLYEY